LCNYCSGKVFVMPTVFRLTALGVLFSTLVLFSGCFDQQPTDKAPSPDFEVSPQEGWAPLIVEFKDASHQGDSKIHAWLWNFGDGITASGPAAKHTYTRPGAYDVTLTVTSSKGNFSKTKVAAVTIKAPGTFGKADPRTGLLTADGAVLKISEPFRAKAQFSIKKGTVPAGLMIPDDVTVLSDVFTIMHNQTSDDFYALDFESKRAPEPANIALPLLSNLDAPVTDDSHLYILAFMEDGRVIPMPGHLARNLFTAAVLRIPQRARYVVVRREDAAIFESKAACPAKALAAEDKEGWGNVWRIHSSAGVGQMLVSLYNGSTADESSFLKRTWSQTAVTGAHDRLAEAVQAIYDTLKTQDLRPPILISEDLKYDLLFFDTLPSYNVALSRANQVPFYETFFGHLVLNPTLLIDLSRRNARMFHCDPPEQIEFPLSGEEEAQWYGCDFDRAFDPDSAFGEALLYTLYPGYQLPVIATAGDTALNLPVPATDSEEDLPLPVNFVDGLLDSYALYYGQSIQTWPARAFGVNERPVYSLPLFFPYSGDVAGYSPASHEFLAWLKKSGAVEDPMEVLPWTLEALKPIISIMSAHLARPLNFNEARAALALAFDEALLELDDTEEDLGLPEFYWAYIKDNLFANSDNAVLRPSDQNRSLWSLNLDKLDASGLLDFTPGGPVENLDFQPENYPVLADIAPLSSRAVVLHFSRLTTDVLLDFSGNKWREDKRGNGVGIAVYLDGYPGIDLSDAPGDYVHYSLIDKDQDGKTDIVRFSDFTADQEYLLDKVTILISNLNPQLSNSVSFSLQTHADVITPESSILHRYVYSPDPAYGYELTSIYNRPDYSAYLLNMTSGSWRASAELYETEWHHKMAIVEPRNLRENTALLLIAGGSATSEISLQELSAMAEYATVSRTAVVLLKQTPYQPLYFDDQITGLSEDGIIAYSFNKYMQSYKTGAPDSTWPALLPMTRAAVRAMDTTQTFMAGKPGISRNIDRFVVSGASKRGWTTWLTAAIDPRVCAIVPMVIDVLNMEEQIKHHRAAYSTYPPTSAQYFMQGGYSTALKDYVANSIFTRFDTTEGKSLLSIVDPFYYREVLRMPKLILNSTGDQFFLPDGSQFYFDDLEGLNYLAYLPNSDHSLNNYFGLENSTAKTLLAFHIAQVRNNNSITSDNVEVPHYTWEFGQIANKPHIISHASQKPISALQWTATVPDHRDFRLQTRGTIWASQELEVEEIEAPEEMDGSISWRCVAETVPPAQGWTGFLIQLTFEGPEAKTEFTFTTPVRIISADN